MKALQQNYDSKVRELEANLGSRHQVLADSENPELLMSTLQTLDKVSSDLTKQKEENQTLREERDNCQALLQARSQFPHAGGDTNDAHITGGTAGVISSYSNVNGIEEAPHAE